jgi:hypothetical protein
VARRPRHKASRHAGEKFLGHENGNESQQENQNCTSHRDDDWDVFHDRFNWIVGCL